jgi:hypothetical protein
MRMKPHAYSPNWRAVSPLFVQHLTQNMLDIGGPTSIVATVGTGFRFALSQKVPRLSAIAFGDIEILVTSKNEPSHSAQNGGVSSSEMPALTYDAKKLKNQKRFTDKMCSLCMYS